MTRHAKHVTNFQICAYLISRRKGRHDNFCLAFLSSSASYDMLRMCNSTLMQKVRVLNEKPSMQRKRKSKQAPTESVIMFHTVLHSPFFSLHLVLSILPFPLSILFPPFFVYHSPFMILFSLFTILHSPSSLFHSLFKSLFIPPFSNISPFSRRVPFSINFFL